MDGDHSVVRIHRVLGAASVLDQQAHQQHLVPGMRIRLGIGMYYNLCTTIKIKDIASTAFEETKKQEIKTRKKKLVYLIHGTP